MTPREVLRALRPFSTLSLVFLAGCSIFGQARQPKTLGEDSSGYTYVPIDPVAIDEQPGRYCEGVSIETLRQSDRDPRRSYQYDLFRDDLNAQSGSAAPPAVFRRLLDSFPDNAVRISVEQYDASGTVRYGPSSIGARGERYKVTVDYINADTTTIPLRIAKRIDGVDVSVAEPVDAAYKRIKAERFEPGRPLFDGPPSVSYVVDRVGASSELESPDRGEVFNIPLYIGLGLRVTADVSVLRSNAKIEGLGVIGAEAESGRLSGSLVVQTLGVNGKSISAALPIQSELNRTTAQSAVVAIGSIKALLYEAETIVSPRVVGLYLPFPGDKDLVNKIISVLSEKPIPWKRPCERARDDAGRETAAGSPQNAAG